MSQGVGDTRGPWNDGEQWDYVTEREKQMAVDGGTGGASVDLGAGPGAGSTTGESAKRDE